MRLGIGALLGRIASLLAMLVAFGIISKLVLLILSPLLPARGDAGLETGLEHII